MCMFCAAVPMAAAGGVALESKQRRKRQMEGRPEQRARPIMPLTMLVILLLLVISVYVHIKFPRYF